MGRTDKKRRTRLEYSIIHRLDYQSSFFTVSLGADGAARPHNGDRGIGGKCPKEGVPSPGADDPTEAAVAGVRIPPAAAGALPGAYKPGDSTSPTSVPEKPQVPPEGVRRPESGGCAEGE